MERREKRTLAGGLPRGVVGAAVWSVACVGAVLSSPGWAKAQAEAGWALIAWEVACRGTPSRVAGVVTFVRDVRWRRPIVARGARTDVGGEKWIHLGDRSCWVPASMLARTRGARYLSRIADHLLSSDQRHSLRAFAFAYGKLTNPRYEKVVSESPILGLRRLQLLERALEEVREEDIRGRAIDSDPLVLAWVESLGEVVTYSPNPPPRARVAGESPGVPGAIRKASGRSRGQGIAAGVGALGIRAEAGHLGRCPRAPPRHRRAGGAVSHRTPSRRAVPEGVSAGSALLGGAPGHDRSR